MSLGINVTVAEEVDKLEDEELEEDELDDE